MLWCGRVGNGRAHRHQTERQETGSPPETVSLQFRLIGRPINAPSTVSVSQNALLGSVGGRIQRPDQCRFLKTRTTEDEAARASVNRRHEPLAKLYDSTITKAPGDSTTLKHDHAPPRVSPRSDADIRVESPRTKQSFCPVGEIHDMMQTRSIGSLPTSGRLGTCWAAGRDSEFYENHADLGGPPEPLPGEQ